MRAVCSALLGLLACACSTPAISTQAHPRDTGNADWEKGVYVGSTPTRRQMFTLTDFRELVVTDETLDPTTNTWQRLDHRSSVSFDVLRTATATLDAFCFAGFAEDGDFVLERWTLVPPAPTGGEESALAIKEFQTAGLYRGPLAERVIDVEFDRDERYILALVGVGDQRLLYRFENVSEATPALLLGSAGVPELARMKYMQKLQHASFGRVVLLTNDTGMSERIALIDSQNDGVFENPPLVGSSADFESIGFDDFTKWDALLGP